MEHPGFEVVWTSMPVFFETGRGRPAGRLRADRAAETAWVATADDGAGDDAWDTGTIIKERPAEPKLKRPPMYKVIMLNDDYTPMEFVVNVLMMFFHMDQDKAQQVMYAVHTTGSAVVGIFPRDIAETKSEQVNAYAQENEFPLRSTVEMTD